MPSTAGLEMFLRKDQITNSEWLRLLEARRLLINPYLDSITLPELGTLECLYSDVREHILRMDSPDVCGKNENFCLGTQGIFFASNREYTSPDPFTSGTVCRDGRMHIWGLTRSSVWVLAMVTFVGEKGYKGRGYERAKTVTIRPEDLSVIAEKTRENPRLMWEKFGKAVKGLIGNRLRLYEQLFSIARMIEVEELICSLVSKES